MTTTHGEKTTPSFFPPSVPLAHLNQPYGLCGALVDVDTTDFEPGYYAFSGNFMIAVWHGYTMWTHHIDIGTNLTPETAPAGGAGWGDHNPVIGDAGPGYNGASILNPVGTRIVKIDCPGVQHVYMRSQVSHNGPTYDGVNSCYGSGCLNWHKVADL